MAAPHPPRAAGTASAAARAYVEEMRAIYYDCIECFNSTYGTTHDGFDDLLADVDWRDEVDPQNVNELRDNARFLERVVDQYYPPLQAAMVSFSQDMYDVALGRG